MNIFMMWMKALRGSFAIWDFIHPSDMLDEFSEMKMNDKRLVFRPSAQAEGEDLSSVKAGE